MSIRIPFQVIKWDNIEQVEHPGNAGTSHWQMIQHLGLWVRVVQYGPGYLADH